MNEKQIKEVGERIAATRKLAKMTRPQLAAVAGISRMQMGRIEKGERWPTLEALILMADRLEESLDYLVGRIPKKSAKSH